MKKRKYILYVQSTRKYEYPCQELGQLIKSIVTESHSSVDHLTIDVERADKFNDLKTAPCKHEYALEIANSTDGRGRSNHFISKELIDASLRSLPEISFYSIVRLYS